MLALGQDDRRDKYVWGEILARGQEVSNKGDVDPHVPVAAEAHYHESITL
jgi:hypothetical protein